MKPQQKKNTQNIHALRSGKILVQDWSDRRIMIMISTYYQGDETVLKPVRGKSELTKKTLLIENYITYMGGVDLHDQHTSYYKFAQKSIK